MNLKKEFPLPEFCILDAENHHGDELEGRTVLLHAPTHTFLEVVSVFPEEIDRYKDAQQFGFVFENAEGEDENHIFLLHSTSADEESLADLYPKAAKWYSNYALWIDEEVGKL